MIYVADIKLGRQFGALRAVAGSSDFDTVLWLSPSQGSPEPFGLPPADVHRFASPTHYGTKPEVALSAGLFSAALAERLMSDDLLDHCDSIALYPDGKRDWYACMYPKRVCLCADDGQLARLLALGYPATLDPPPDL